MKKLKLKHITDVPDPGEGYSLVTTSISSTGAGLFLFVEKEASSAVHEQEKQGFGIFPKAKMASASVFRLVIYDGRQLKTVDIGKTDFTFPFVEIFPDGRVLLISARCQWRSENDFDLNGLIYDPKTKKRSAFLVGDGVEGVSIDERGRIWVSYFDEGVFGNYGWASPGPRCIGEMGLNCFNGQGEIIWRFQPPENGSHIDDCYAMNVVGTNVFIYFYSDFPLCSIGENFELRFRETELNGSHAFAIEGNTALFSGQYNEPLSRFHHMSLGEHKLKKLNEVEVVLPNGDPIRDGRMLARGRHVHFFDSDSWYRGDIRDL